MRFELGLGFGRTAGSTDEVIPAITGIAISNSEIDDDAAVGTLIGTMIMIGGVEPVASFVLTTNPSSHYQVDGSDLEVAADISAAGGTEEEPVVRVTDALGQVFEAILPITIAVTEGANDSGIGEGDGTVVNDGGFDIPPIVQDTSGGLKLAGKSGGVAKFVFDIGAPAAGEVYTYRYTANWSDLSQDGRRSFVGFGFKTGNDFHFSGLKGNGANPASMLAYQIYGAGKFSASTGFSTVDGGAAAYGSKDGPNWIQIEIDGAGEAYTLRTSADGVAWTEEFTAVLPTPLAEAAGAITFGIAVFLENNDKGVFELLITDFSGLVSVPAQFGAGDWSAADAKTGNDIKITVTTLPSDGGSAITDLERQIDGGAWVSLGGTSTGDYIVEGLTNDVEVTVAIRAVNAIGNGTASATKAATPTTFLLRYFSMDIERRVTTTDPRGRMTGETGGGYFGNTAGVDGKSYTAWTNNYSGFLFGGTPDTLIFGMHATQDSSATTQRPRIQLRNASGDVTQEFVVAADLDTLTVTNLGVGAAPVAVAAIAIPEWFWISAKVVFHDTAGSIEVAINGTTYYTATGIDTLHANGKPNRIVPFNFMTVEPAPNYDNLVICDGNGPAPFNALLPTNLHVGTMLPTGDVTANWTPFSGATNFEMIDEQEYAGGNDYLTAAAGDTVCRVSYGSFATAVPLAVQLSVSAYQGNAGAGTGQNLIAGLHNGAVTISETFAFTSTTLYFLHSFAKALNPSQWGADLAGVEASMTTLTGEGSPRAQQLALEVLYQA